MAASIFRKSRAVKQLLSVIMICALLPGSLAWGGLQPPLSQTNNPVFGTTGGIVPADVPPNLSPYIKNVPAAIQLGKALFWDMQAGSDGVTACASCHYRGGADPVVGTLPKDTAKRDRNQLHPGPDTIFGNNSTVIRTFNKLAVVAPGALPAPVILRATGFPIDPNVPAGASRFAPNYILDTLQDFLNPLDTFDFPLFLLSPPNARLLLVNTAGNPDPVNGLTGDAVTSARDTNDVVGSQGVRLAQFTGIDPNLNANPAVDFSTQLTDQLFHIVAPNPVNNIRQVTGRNAPSVINAVFNYSNFWDGRANNIFNGETPFGPLDQTAGIWIDNGAALVKQKIAIPNASLASQAVGPALSDVEMSFKGRTFPELGRKMLDRIPLAKQFVHPQDSVLGTLSRDPLGNNTGLRGINVPGNNSYRTMIKAAFQDNLTGNRTINLPTVANPLPAGEPFDQIEANFSLFWGLAIQLYEATLVSDRAPFDRFQAGNQNSLTPDLILTPNIPSAVRGLTLFDSKCAVCHSGSELTSAVVGSNNCLPSTLPTDCNRVAFTNNSSHKLINQEVNPITFEPSLADAGFFNIGVRPTSDDPGRGGSKFGFPLSFSKLAVQALQTGLPFVTPKLPAGFTTTDKVQGSFKAPGLRNVELTAPYFHNGDALTLNQVVEFYTRGGNFPNNPELAVAMQPIRNLNAQFDKQADLVEFLKALTDDRVRNETAPFDHPELMIPNGVDGVDATVDAMIDLPATGGGPAPVPAALVMQSPAPAAAPATLTTLAPTTLTTLVFSGTVNASAIVEVKVNALPPVFASVTGTTWSLDVTGLPVGNNTITITASTPGGVPETITVAPLTVLPVALINGAPSGGTNRNDIVLTITGAGVVSYKYSLDGEPFSAYTPKATQIIRNGLSDGVHTVSVLGRDDATGNQQPADAPTTATWRVKTIPPLLTLDAANFLAGSSTQTISGTVELGSIPSVSVPAGATARLVKTVPSSGISTWSCDISGLAAGANNFTVATSDFAFNTTTVDGVITRILPDGNIVEDGAVDISDALKALRIAVELEQPTVLDMLHGDIAPFVNGLPTRNNQIDVGDALLILRKTVGSVTF